MATTHVCAWRVAYAHIFPVAFLAGLSIPDWASRWDRIIDAAESNTDVAEVGGRVVAFASHGRCRDQSAPPDRGEIRAVYAEPSSWRQGVGRALLGHALSALGHQGYQETTLWVLAENLRGRRFYEANGFALMPGSGILKAVGGVHVPELQYLHRHAV
jgi:GNAT superfamily N-acetyltransferase